ncbi:hypothetical protein [Algoriphagus sp.]|uniref:hypothetical protein n=1 Tax=Algoriphagus sp. TaxID=1872435 RepID=UPI0025DAC29C|nr:hypothetical protein [Algoriphagus sp.]
MKLKLLLAFLSITFFFSCKEEQMDISPAQLELGKYQLEVKGSTYDLINTIELKIEGNVIGSGIIKNSGESEDLGYNYYFTGKYTMKDDVISVFQESYFQTASPSKLFDSREMLILVMAGSESSDFIIKSNYTELHLICPSNSLCVDQPIYKKVE